MGDRFDIFVSYAHREGEVVGELVAALERLGLAVYRDRDEIEDFESISRSVERGLGRSKTLLAYYSVSYSKRRACQWELTAAFLAAQRQGDPRHRVLVVNPEEGAGHIDPVELRDELFAAAPAGAGELDIEALARRIAEHVRGVEGLLGEVVPLVPPAWYPEPRVGSDRFVGRLAEMWAVHSALQASGLGMITGAVSAVAQLRGLGGVGKSLLAEEYALRFGAAYPGGVFWLRAFGDGEGSLDPEARGAERERQLEGFAARLGIEIADPDPDRVRGALARWLTAQPGACLWVVDDLPSGLDGEVPRWLAPHPSARTLITTRSREYDALGRRTDLRELPETEAIELLTKRRRPQTEQELAAANAISAELGHHPLALDVASAALRYQTFGSFLDALREPSEDWLDRLTGELRDALPNGHERSIARTLSRSIERLGGEGLDFLRLASLLAAAPLSADLVASVFAAVDGLDERVAQARQATALDAVESLSLAEGAGELSWRVHALVLRTVKFTDGDFDRRKALRDAAIETLIVKAAALVRPGARTGTDDVVAHARELIQDASTSRELLLLDWIAGYDYERGDYRSAAALWRRQLGARRQLLGEEHADTLTTLNNLSVALRDLGDLAGARRLQEQVVETRRRMLGDEHPDTLTALSSFTNTLRVLGELREAERIQTHVVERSRRVLGDEHPDTLTALNNLALVFGALGDNQGARALQQQVLDVRARTMGDEHPQTLVALNNLSGTLRELGDLTGARELEARVVDARRAVLGDEHPETLIAVSNLAYTLWALGDYANARQLQEQTLDARLRIFGEEHPGTLASANNLALTLRSQGDHASARQLQERVLEIYRRVFGAEHPDTLAALGNLARTFRELGEISEAFRLQQQVVDARRRVLGEEHFATLTALNELAQTVSALGDPLTASQLHKQVVDTRRRVLGDEHQDTLTALSDYAVSLGALGDHAGALGLQEQVVEGYRRVLGPEHPYTLIAFANVANTLGAMGDLSRSAAVWERVAEACRLVFGEQHPYTLSAQGNLAELRGQGY